MDTSHQELIKAFGGATMGMIKTEQEIQKLGRKLGRCKFCGCVAHHSIPKIGDMCDRCCKMLSEGITYGIIVTYSILDKAGFFTDDDEDEIKERIPRER